MTQTALGDILDSLIGSTVADRERTDPGNGFRKNMIIDQEL